MFFLVGQGSLLAKKVCSSVSAGRDPPGVRLKITNEGLLLNGEGYGGVASSALLYYQLQDPPS